MSINFRQNDRISVQMCAIPWTCDIFSGRLNMYSWRLNMYFSQLYMYSRQLNMYSWQYNMYSCGLNMFSYVLNMFFEQFYMFCTHEIMRNRGKNMLYRQKNMYNRQENMYNCEKYMYNRQKNMYNHEENMYNRQKYMYNHEKNMFNCRKNMFNHKENMFFCPAYMTDSCGNRRSGREKINTRPLKKLHCRRSMFSDRGTGLDCLHDMINWQRDMIACQKDLMICHDRKMSQPQKMLTVRKNKLMCSCGGFNLPENNKKSRFASLKSQTAASNNQRFMTNNAAKNGIRSSHVFFSHFLLKSSSFIVTFGTLVYKSMQEDHELPKKIENLYLDYLKANNLKRTKERDFILISLCREKGHTDAEALYKKLCDNPQFRVSKSAIYDALNLFVSAGIASKHVNNKTAEYELAENSKKHVHLKCIHCGKIIEARVNPTMFENSINAAKYNFSPCYFSFFSYGICHECETKQKK